VAIAPIQPLAWEPPYAAGAAQEIATTMTKDIEEKKKLICEEFPLWLSSNKSD